MTLIIAGGLIAVLIAATLIIGAVLSGPSYKGPKSGHFDGKKFANDPPFKHGIKGVVKWMFTRNKTKWAKWIDIPQAPAPDESVSGLRITFVNHSTFLIQLAGINILTDPIWSNRASPFSFAGPKRAKPPGIPFDSLPPIHFVLLSHNHYDHLDIPTLKRLADLHKPRILAPLGIGALLEGNDIRNSHDMDWWDERKLTGGIRITCVPARHFSGRGMLDRNTTLWGGFVITKNGKQIYFAGDTGFGPHFQRIFDKFGAVDIALLPIGAYEPRWFMKPVHLNPEDAVKAHLLLKAELSIATHFGTFQLADEGCDKPKQDLAKALEKLGVARSAFRVLENGERVGE